MCRETASIWFYLRSSGRRFGYFYWLRFFKRRMWKHPYFWQDSVLVHFNRLMGCRILGHREVKYLPDGGCANNEAVWYCFGCGREVNG